jgi:hypothetical protein
MCIPDRVNRSMIFKLWLHCCRQAEVVTLEQFIDFQPHAEENIRFYDKFVDAEGKTTLNIEEQMALRQEKAKAAEIKKKEKKAKAG